MLILEAKLKKLPQHYDMNLQEICCILLKSLFALADCEIYSFLIKVN
jgi:hypothetical protein